MITLGALCANVPPDTSMEDFEATAELLIGIQKGIMWQIGDIALAAEQQYPDTHHQAWPINVSPGLLDRCKGVARAYAPNERNPEGTWTMHAFHAKSPDRVEIIEDIVELGQTSDEARKNPPPIREPKPELPAVSQESAPVADEGPRWLLCVDISYYMQRQFPKCGQDTAVEVCAWLARVIRHLEYTKNLTDAVVCFDGANNHRKALTADWDQPYKSKRSDKDEELIVQLRSIPERLREINLPCVKIDGMEADDVMASYAAQFPGKVTLMTSDKDLRQCLSPRCNILRNVEWETNPDTGQLIRTFDWVSAKKHTEEGVSYGGPIVKGIPPALWPHFQAIAGDSGDDIRGCVGIGAKIAMDLIHQHGTVQNIIDACLDGSAKLTAKKIDSVLAFAEYAETTLLLTTMRTDLVVPMVTKINMREKT